MHIAVLAARNSWYLADLVRASGGRHEITPVSYTTIGSHVHGGELSIHSGYRCCHPGHFQFEGSYYFVVGIQIRISPHNLQLKGQVAGHRGPKV